MKKETTTKQWKKEWDCQFALLSESDQKTILAAPTGATTAKLAVAVDKATEAE